MDSDEIAEALGATVVGERQEDGTWLCECGRILGSDFMLYMHRRYDHRPIDVD